MFARHGANKNFNSRNAQWVSEMVAGLAITVAFSCAASAQSLNRQSNSSAAMSDSTTVLFEDVYGRFPNGVMPSLSVAHYDISYQGGIAPMNPSYTNGGVGFTLGNRKTYELTGNFQNFGQTGSTPSQSYDLGFNSRPIAGWQFGGTAFLQRSPGMALTDQYYLGLTVLNLSSGEVSFSQSRLQQYYYFSDLLPDAGQTVFSFSPTYSDSKLSSGNNNTIEAPFTFSYGLPSRFTLVAEANFSQHKNSYPYKDVYTTQTMNNLNGEFTAGAGLKRMFGNSTLASFNADYYSLENQTPHFNGTTGAYENGASQKQTFAVLSIGLNNLFLNTPLSVYDVRRSYYLGHYLHKDEASNSLTVRYATQDIMMTETLIQPLVPFNFSRFGVDDKFNYGILGMLELNAEGALLQHSSRYGSIGLTLHNLNFNGAELSDFDYFFGMINRPGDYTLSVDFSSSNIDYTPSTQISTDVRYGIIRDMDVSLNYSYQKFNSSNSTFGQSGNSWGFQLRGNLFGFMRAQGSIDWGRTDYSVNGPVITRINQVQYNLTIETFF